MNVWYSTIYKAFIMTSMILFSIYFLTTGPLASNSLMAAYVTLVLGISMILLILFNNSLKNNQGVSGAQQTLAMLMISGPFLLMMGIVCFVMYMTSAYSKHISSGHVSNGYYVFSNMLVSLLLIQVIMVYNEISKVNTDSPVVSKVTTSLIYLLSLLTGLCSGVLYVILRYYTTDG